MEANQFAEAFDLIIPAAGAGEPWAQREMTKLTEAVVYPKVHRPETIGPEYAEAMALGLRRYNLPMSELSRFARYRDRHELPRARSGTFPCHPWRL